MVSEVSLDGDTTGVQAGGAPRLTAAVVSTRHASDVVHSAANSSIAIVDVIEPSSGLMCCLARDEAGSRQSERDCLENIGGGGEDAMEMKCNDGPAKRTESDIRDVSLWGPRVLVFGRGSVVGGGRGTEMASERGRVGRRRTLTKYYVCHDMFKQLVNEFFDRPRLG